MLSLSNLSLSQKIGVIVLAGLTIGLGLFSFLGIQALNKSTELILNERLIISRISATYLDEALNYVLVQSQNSADFHNKFPSGEQFNSNADSLHQIFIKSNIFVRNIFLIDSSGKVVLSEPDDSPMIGANLAEYVEVKQALEKGTPTISGLISDSHMSAPAEFITAPILDSQGKSIGAIISSIDIQQSNIGALNQMAAVGKTAYSEIIDGNGIVIARTKPGSSPSVIEKSDHPERFADLIRRGEPMVGTCHRCHETSQNVQRREDILAFAPLSNASWGIVIRQAQEEALAPTLQLERELLLLGIIVLVATGLLVWSMMQGVVKPIKILTTAAKRIAVGDYKPPVPTKRGDEIGQLSTAFYTMTEELTRSRDELVARNQELKAINSIAVTVSQSLDLQQLLGEALQRVLEVTRTSVGVIFLADSGSNRLEVASQFGSSSILGCKGAASPESDCACHQVLRQGQTLMVNHVSQCPLLNQSPPGENGSARFVCVPLKSKERSLGIMNIICSGERSFTENDFRLLDSIGYHIGLALENSVLYENLKQKEELRGKLLSSVITAQEEERKRIAREIHDEYGQTLAGLIMSVESLETMILPEQNNLKQKIQSTKIIVTRALEEMRRLALDLRPLALDDLGLATAIRAYVRSRLETTGINVKFEIEGLSQRLSPPVETAIFRIIQEAVNNVARHASAHNVTLRLEAHKNRIIVAVEDDGKGFDINSVKSRVGVKSLGLLGIRERTTILGGNFSIDSQIGQGTRLKIEIPVNGSNQT